MTSTAQPVKRRVARLPCLREHEWRPVERAAVISVIAIAMGSLFVTSYSLALGDPVPHRIDTALVGNPMAHASTVAVVRRLARASLVFRRYGSRRAALHAVEEQRVYTALDLTSA